MYKGILRTAAPHMWGSMTGDYSVLNQVISIDYQLPWEMLQVVT